jgi:hypothetical protein
MTSTAKRLNSLWLGGILASLVMGPPAVAGEAPKAKVPDDARAIMEAVYKRDLGTNLVQQIRMQIEGRAGGTRDRLLETMSRAYDNSRKTLIIFEKPAEIRNTAFLNVDYDDGGVPDDQWLYLPAIAKPTRISTTGKSGAFVGSDFSYSDFSRADPKEYDFTLVAPEEKVDGEPCWLIESRPRTKRSKDETGYLKSLLWVSKAKLMIVRSKSWVERGKEIKYISFGDIRLTAGIWTFYAASARTMKGDKLLSKTTIEVLGLKYNDPTISDRDFTEQRLAEGI